jgi:hypothetical protein
MQCQQSGLLAHLLIQMPFPNAQSRLTACLPPLPLSLAPHAQRQVNVVQLRPALLYLPQTPAPRRIPFPDSNFRNTKDAITTDHKKHMIIEFHGEKTTGLLNSKEKKL